MIEVSREARSLAVSSDVIDLHVDSFIWKRIFGYDLRKKHGLGPTRGVFCGQVDLPRIQDAGIKGAIWSITTNPLRSSARKPEVLLQNLRSLVSILETDPREAILVRSHSDYVTARLNQKHAVFVGVQGGDVVSYAMPVLGDLASHLIKVTLVHLSRSSIGDTSSPLGGERGLTNAGHELVEWLNEKRIFVDLAHINRTGFFDALRVHDSSIPAIVSHTGVSGVYPHWRNLNDEQVRAVAGTGGVVGIMYQTTFLGPKVWIDSCDVVLDHLEHVIRIGGEGCAALGSDWDGMIIPPRELRDCRGITLLIERMLRRGWSLDRIYRVLGGNYLRALKSLRSG